MQCILERWHSGGDLATSPAVQTWWSPIAVTGRLVQETITTMYEVGVCGPFGHIYGEGSDPARGRAWPSEAWSSCHSPASRSRNKEATRWPTRNANEYHNNPEAIATTVQRAMVAKLKDKIVCFGCQQKGQHRNKASEEAKKKKLIRKRFCKLRCDRKDQDLSRRDWSLVLEYWTTWWIIISFWSMLRIFLQICMEHLQATKRGWFHVNQLLNWKN